MITLRDAVMLAAGAEAFHTLSHVLLGVMVTLPLQVTWPRIAVTAQVNAVAIGVNALITVALLWWAVRL